MHTLEKTRYGAYWGRRAVYNLFRKFNCPEATMQTCQDMIGREEDGVLTAISGLVAGVKGSTCGVVSGGALGLGLMHADELQRDGVGTEAGVMALASDYVKGFDQTYGTTLCSERTNVDFWTLRGLLRYLMPGHRMVPCMIHIHGSLKRLCEMQEVDLPQIAVDNEVNNIHCARDVLKGIRERTGVGDPVLEKISMVLDGGVAYSGGLCGALAGAVLAIHLLLGDNLREISLPRSYYIFLKGLTYLRAEEEQDCDHSYNGTRKMALPFEESAGSINCREITGRDFSGWDDFQSHIRSADRCRELIEFSISHACQILEEFDSINRD